MIAYSLIYSHLARAPSRYANRIGMKLISRTSNGFRRVFDYSRHQPGINFFPSRTIINIADLKGTYNSLSNSKHLALLQGAVFDHTGSLNRLYDFAITESNPSHVSQLVLALFYKKGNQFRVTKNKSKPAYSLTPQLLGKLISHLEAGTLGTSDIRKEFYAEWRKIHKTITAGSITIKQIDLLLDKLIAAKNECSNKKNFVNLTETILLSFIYLKSETRQEALSYLTASHYNYSCELRNTVLTNDVFDEADLDKGNGILEEISNLIRYRMPANSEKLKSLVAENYETLVLTLITRLGSLPQVLISCYGYGEIYKANCAEAAFHNLCNILLYNHQKRMFDFSLLPATLKPHPKLIELYKMQDYKTNAVNSPEIGQAFMDLLSRHSFLIYASGDFELSSRHENALPLLNYLYGTNAANLAELSELFSDERRKITFEKNDDNNISIEIANTDGSVEHCQLAYKKNHTDLFAERFNNNNSRDESLSMLAWKLDFAGFKFSDYPLLLPILHQVTGVDDLLNLTLHVTNITPEYLHYFFTHFFPKDPDQAFEFICVIVPLVETYPEVEIYITYLIKNFKSLLNHAAKNHLYEIAAALVHYGASPNARDQHGQISIHIVDSEPIVDLLLTAGANPRAIDAYGLTPLHYCENLKIAKALLKAGADIEAVDGFGRTPVHYHKDAETLKFFIDAGVNLNVADCDGNTPVFYFQLADTLKVLLSGDVNVDIRNAQKCSPLHTVTGKELTEILLAGGFKPTVMDEDGRTPLHYSLAKRHTEKSLALLAAGIDVDIVDKDGCAAIHLVHDVEVLQIMLNAGVNIQVANKFGCTALHYARNKEIAQLLIDAGINLHAVNSYGKSALHTAAIGEIAEVLVNAGIDIHAVDDDGNTALHGQDNVEIVNTLLKAGCDPSVKNLEGRTPVHMADDVNVLRLLLAGGLNPAAVDDDGNTDAMGRTPMYYAFYPRVRQLLFKAGADLEKRVPHLYRAMMKT